MTVGAAGDEHEWHADLLAPLALRAAVAPDGVAVCVCVRARVVLSHVVACCKSGAVGADGVHVTWLCRLDHGLHEG